jgi:hypothetical protein
MSDILKHYVRMMDFDAKIISQSNWRAQGIVFDYDTEITNMFDITKFTEGFKIFSSLGQSAYIVYEKRLMTMVPYLMVELENNLWYIDKITSDEEENYKAVSELVGSQLDIRDAFIRRFWLKQESIRNSDDSFYLEFDSAKKTFEYVNKEIINLRAKL